ncbi:MAG: HD domain-containing protein [Dactylosporangium sp.]|nr:HD domain-containing protein [Dactylosporangium sp.]NNJ59728.1 HD domain-containing protein [Dactylosporangium sp.]
MEHVRWARDLALRLLAETLPGRWSHTRGVARAAEAVCGVLDEDANRLVCAAWLHDVGYAPRLATTGFHPLDGARHLRDVEQVDELVCRLVANHSCAAVEAGQRNLAGALVMEFPPVGGLLADALTYVDMTTDPAGNPVSVDDRLGEVLSRYGPGSVVAESIAQARPDIRRAVQAVTAALVAQRDR